MACAASYVAEMKFITKAAMIIWTAPVLVAVAYQYAKNNGSTDDIVELSLLVPVLIPSVVVIALVYIFSVFWSRPIYHTRQQQANEETTIVPYSLTQVPNDQEPLLQLTTKLETETTLEMIFILGGCIVESIATKTANELGVRAQIPRPITKDSSNNLLSLPTSPIAKAALALCRKAAVGEFAVQHCIRTYLFGVAIADQLGIVYDRDTLFVASILHDLAWSRDYDSDDLFEVAGAQHAYKFCKQQQKLPKMTDHQARVIHEMIALHTSPNRLHNLPPEVRLVSLGAGVDVAGFNVEDVHPATLATIVQAHPRLDFKNQCCKITQDQCQRKPHCHISKWCDVGFVKMVQTGPFDE